MTEEQQNPESGAQAADSAGTTETPRRRRTTRTPRIGRARRKKNAPVSDAPEILASPDATEPTVDAPLEAGPESNAPPELVAPPAAVEVSKEQPASEPQPTPVIEKPPQPPAPIVYAEGIVEVSGKGFGFLREARRNFTQSNNDIFVTPEIVRKYALRDGMWIKGEIRRGNRGPQMYKLTELEGGDPERFQNLPVFEELSVINPNERIKLETVPERFTTRVIDLVAPVGKGQRGLIVAPPRTGKTTLLQHIADAVVKNHPEMKLLILLVDERPEEVTEIRRTVPTAELMASSNDSDIKTHTRIAQLCIDRARRLVEMGKDVFVLMDSLTRIGRAFNNAQGGGGRTMSGGVDARALEIPRKLFAAARNTEEAGSLTIMATALIETNSRMDELIFQEFKGTGNMEIVLDRKISDQRIYPAIDIFQSGTRREELLISEADLHKISVIRRGLAGHKPIEAIERLLFFIRKYPTNEQLLKNLPG
ncbi:MAG: transcription termination factor Rho [bacterium]